MLWKPVIVSAVALMVVGSTVLAQNRLDGLRRFEPTMQDMRAFADARLAALKAGLVLNPDQEKNWPAFEQAARDYQKLRLDRLSAAFETRRSGRPSSTDPVARMEQRADALSQTGAALKKLADATGPLYNSLDDGQKRRFAILSRLGRDGERGERLRGFLRERGERGFRRGEERGIEGAPRSFGQAPGNEERL
jgi:zinc resistance-associated protein